MNVYVSTGPAQVSVPDLANQSQDAAQQALQAAGLQVGAVSSDYSPTAPEGTVLESDPASGSSITKGSVVNLTVSNGKVQLPDVTNQPFTTANQTLLNLGLTVGQNPSYSCTGGLVTQQDQPAGDIAQGSTVTLTYCAGSTQTQQPSPAARAIPARTTRRARTAREATADVRSGGTVRLSRPVAVCDRSPHVPGARQPGSWRSGAWRSGACNRLVATRLIATRQPNQSPTGR